MYVYNKSMDFLFFTYDDKHIVLSLLEENGEFDNKHVLCSSPEALDFGKELFEHCLKDSTPINSTSVLG
uniref:transcriptional regulator FilR1 domain-containing protein n=1 Tax=Methanolobus halotolerans TaxID=2052935 RepID=UPI001F32AD02|nr:transcriptional regulator FilR1 domain-containing protein [Methanolobus halotolerans]